MRGKWILENLLGSPPPLPPPDVPPLEEKPTATGEVGARAHRAASRESGVRGLPQDHGPDRAGARELRRVGRWRTTDEGVAIDASGQLVDGTPIDGPSSLRKAMLERSDAFVAAMTEKLLMYGVGPRDEVLRHAGGPHRHARRGEESLSVLRSGPGRREERAVSDEE